MFETALLHQLAIAMVITALAAMTLTLTGVFMSERLALDEDDVEEM